MSLVSIVIPLYNEEENVEALYKELDQVTSSWDILVSLFLSTMAQAIIL